MRTSDCHISDCVMIDCHTAVDNAGCNFYSRIHAWMTVKHIEGSIFSRTMEDWSIYRNASQTHSTSLLT